MQNMFLGWTLIGIGIVSTGAGIAGGIVKMMRKIGKNRPKGPAPTGLDSVTELLRALKELIVALANAPIWLALVVIGFALIAWGGALIK